MPNFPIIMRSSNLKPFEGIVQAATIEAAIEVAARMGHDVDREATLKLAQQDAGYPGRAANIAAMLLALGGWFHLEIGLAAIILAVIAVERSRARRGLTTLVFAFLSMIAGIVMTYMKVRFDQ